MTNKKAILQFAYDRLHFIHGEKENVDWMIHLKDIIDETPPRDEI